MQAPDQPKIAEAEPAEDDRTLWVDVDRHEVRRKLWRDVHFKSHIVSMPDVSQYGIDGPPSALDPARTKREQGGNPVMWFTELIKALGLETNDRIVYVMRALAQAFQIAGEHDQLNVGGVVVCEGLARIIYSYVGACSDPKRPRWHAARFFTYASASLVTQVSPALGAYIARKAKREQEIETMRGKVDKFPRDPSGAEGAAEGARWHLLVCAPFRR